MMVFEYHARGLDGSSQSGEAVAMNRQDLLRQLAARHVIPYHVAIKREPRARSTKLSRAERGALFRSLSELLDAGVPLLRALHTVQNQHSANSNTGNILEILIERITDGETLATAMSANDSPFRDIEIAVIRAGEAGGFLNNALNKVSEFIEQEEAFRHRVLSAVSYPAFLVFCGVAVVAVLLGYFIPRFIPFFEQLQSQGQLPMATTLLLGISQSLTDNFWAWLIGAVGLVAGLGFYFSTQEGKSLRDRWLLKCWGISNLVSELHISRLGHILGTLIQNQVPLPDALKIAAETSDHEVIRNAIERATSSISAGGSLTDPLSESHCFTPDLLEMIAVGEQTNQLGPTFRKVGLICDERSERRMDTLLRFLEPALLLLIAAGVLFVILALQVPILQLGGAIR